MEQVHRDQLRSNHVALVEGMPVTSVLNPLLAEGIITAYQYEVILAEKTRSKRASRLLNILPTRGPEAFSTFEKALTEAGAKHLAKLLLTPKPDYYTWHYKWSVDGHTMLQSYQKFTSEAVCRKDGEQRRPQYTTFDGPGAPTARLVVVPHNGSEVQQGSSDSLPIFHHIKKNNAPEIWKLTLQKDSLLGRVRAGFQCPRCFYFSEVLGGDHACLSWCPWTPYECLKCGGTVLPRHDIVKSDSDDSYTCAWCQYTLPNKDIVRALHQTECPKRPKVQDSLCACV